MHDMFHDVQGTVCFTICFTICLFLSPDLDGHRAPKINIDPATVCVA